MVWQLLLVLRLLPLAAAEETSAVLPDFPIVIKPECPSKCGNVSIPYPFGIGKGCFREGFDITCNDSTHIPHLSTSNLAMVDIQLSHGLLVVNHYIAKDCYDPKNHSSTIHNEPWINMEGLPNYKFSDVRNKFMAIGCDTLGYIYSDEPNFWTGCLSHCNDSSAVLNGTCSGIGCCATSIPLGLRKFDILVTSYSNHSNCSDFSPCGYGFLADEGWLNFTLANLTNLRDVEMAPVTLDWAIMGQTCEQAQGNTPATYACVSPNSYCSNSTNGPGYLCNCTQGFQGNPYLENGCQDIDECANAIDPPCVLGARCKNTEGSYSCSCPWYKYGDGRNITHGGSGCKSILGLLYVALGVGLCLFFLIVIGSWIYWNFKKKRLRELKEKFFQQNGGSLLQQQQLQGSSRSATKVFSSEELRVSTDNYKQSRILGEGGAGTVYEGVLPDQTVVAIKKSKITNEIEIEQFINEVIVLSHINHRNVVKLMGCCLETEVPMLVYEFVPNGTLSYHIHDEGRKGSLSLENRLRIASEVAGALSYLHSAASIPIIHRDVKSTNILLDDNLTAKVADFGASRLIPLDQNGLVSLVRGTFGYLDPEYLQTGQFTDKSDVYSFGVVLVELLTGEKPMEKTRFADCKNLATLFILYVNGGRLLQVLEERVVNEGTQELLEGVSELAMRCLSLKGDDRPSMREVAMELEGLRKFRTHPWVNNEEEAEHLLGETGRSLSTSASREYDDSMNAMMPFNIMR